MLTKERTIDMGIVVKYGTHPQKGIIRTRKGKKEDKKNEVVIEANGIGFAIDVSTLLDFLEEARII